jgi:hypothetical protein
MQRLQSVAETRKRAALTVSYRPIHGDYAVTSSARIYYTPRDEWPLIYLVPNCSRAAFK